MARVTSYEYVIASNLGAPGILQAIADSPSDLVILGAGTGAGGSQLTLNKTAVGASKLIVGYLDVAEAAPTSEPDLFSGASLPSWFGQPNPGYQSLYSVQYWNPAWLAELSAAIDQLIAAGYDGIYLDVLGGDLYCWSQGNVFGNPVYPNATQAMAVLLSELLERQRYKHSSLLQQWNGAVSRLLFPGVFSLSGGY